MVNAGESRVLTDKKHDDKRNQILEAGIRLFRKNGLNNTSLNDIVRESGVSKGGLYHYFSSKEEVVIGVCEYFFQQHLDITMGAPMDMPALDKLALVIRFQELMASEMAPNLTLFVEFYVASRHSVELHNLFQSQYCFYQQLIASFIVEGQAEGTIKADVIPEAFASACIGLMDGVGFATLIAPDNIQYPLFAIEGLTLLVNGAATDQEQWDKVLTATRLP